MTIQRKAAYLGLKRPLGRKKYAKEVDEHLVCRQYEEIRSVEKVAKLNHICNARAFDILKRHGVTVKVLSYADPYREAIIADYRKRDRPISHIAKQYGLSAAVVSTALRRWGETDPTLQHAFTNRIGAYAYWDQHLSEEEAERLKQKQKANLKKSAKRGKDHHFYGKRPHDRVGIGWNGWYKGHHFRSLAEACFMIELDSQGVQWESAETTSIPYTFNGGDRTYRPDFLIGNRLVEVKPTTLQTTPIMLAKKMAAEAYCKDHGLEYEMVNSTVKVSLLNEAYEAGYLRFGGKYEALFLERRKSYKG